MLISNTSMNKRIHFIGLGGAGCTALEHIYQQGIQAKYTCISYPERPELPPDIHFIKYARLSKWHLFEVGNLFKENCRYILLAGLGGNTGSYLVEELTPFLWVRNKEFLVLCSSPFSFEGAQRRIIAEKVKTKFQSMDNFICFDLEDMRQIWGNITLKGAFDHANKEFYKHFLVQDCCVN